MSKALWLTLLAALLPVRLAAADPAAWRVTAPGGGEVTLLGSMHVLRPTDHPLPPSVRALIERADLVVMELDLDDVDPVAQQRTILTTAMLPQGTVLADVIDADVYRLVDATSAKLGIDLRLVESFEPWFLAITLLDQGLRRLGFQGEQGVEQYVLRESQRLRKEIVGLETLEFQIGIFDSLPPAQQQAMLEQTLAELDEAAVVLGDMVEAWKNGDLETLAEELLDEFDAFPGLYDTLVTKRNTAWVPTLETLLADGRRHLVVVGALHLVGPNSVVDLLRARGLTVERLP